MIIWVHWGAGRAGEAGKGLFTSSGWWREMGIRVHLVVWERG